MSKFRSEFINILSNRGFIHQCTDTDELDQLSSKKSITAYIGFDCTANSLHVGSLVQIMMLRWLQRLGHKPIVLLGGGTTKIGDPSGRDEARQLLGDKQIAENKKGIKKSFEPFLQFGKGATDAILVDNDNWLNKLEYVPFLRDVGRHFSVNRMLKFDSVQQRIERQQPLSFLEFNYMILQAYDFVELARAYDCILQMGGSDQWGNIVNGIELARRLNEESLYGLTTPLITLASGAKMGKTARGAVWIDREKVSPYDYWQFWRNTDDNDVCRFLRLFTEMPLDEIERFERVKGEELNEAKKILANYATEICHGRDASLSAEQTSKSVFEQGITEHGLPEIEISSDDLIQGIPAFQLFSDVKLCASRAEARRMIRGGGIRINDIVIEKEDRLISMHDFANDRSIKLSVGKKRHVLVKPS